MRSISLQPKKPKTDIGAYLFSGSVYRAALSRKWAECLLYAIFVALAFPTLILFIASNSYMFLGEPTQDAAEELLEALSGILGTNSIIALLWGAGSGVLSALLSASYLFDKKHAGFVCALPVKRSAYAISNATAGVCSAVASWIPAFLLLFIGAFCTSILRANFGAIIVGFFGAFLTYLCVYIFFFGLTSMAAALCGTIPMTVLMTLFLSFYPLALYFMMITTAGTFLTRLDVSYYFGENMLTGLSSIIRIFAQITTQKSAAYLLSTAALGLLYFAIFVFFCTKRKNEATGQHFVWTFAREGVKYLCMILCGITGGLLFHELSDNGFRFGWMLIGTSIGVIIVWMLCNLVFFKTSTMLFYAKRGMAILLASVLLFMGMISVDLFGLNDYVPSVGMTSSITFQNEIADMEVKGRNLIRMYLAMIENGVAISDDTEYLSPNSFGMVASYDGPLSIVTPSATDSSASGFATTYVYSVFHTKLLFPIARRERVLANDYRTFVSAYASSQDFLERYMEPLYAFIDEGNDSVYAHVDFSTGLFDNAIYAVHLSTEQYAEFASIYEKELREFGDNPMQNQIVGNLRIYSPNLNYPIFGSCTESILWLEDTFGFRMPETPSAEELKMHTISIKLMCQDTVVRALTAEEFLQYLEGGALSYQGNSFGRSYTQYLTLYDANYYVTLSFTKDYLYKIGEIGMDTYEDADANLSYYTRTFCFLEGKAPKT